MASESIATDLAAEERDVETELRHLLAPLLTPATAPLADPILRALQDRLDAREARAYASGWQDAIESIRNRPS